VTVVTNGGTETKRLSLRHPDGYRPDVIWGPASSISSDGSQVTLGKRATVVAIWRQ
jgi:hypothetical protein